MDFTQILSRGTARNMLVVASFILVSGVHAATLDLAGVGTNITDVAELADYDCVTNSSVGDPVTLTFNNSGSITQEYAGVISGNIRLVKDGGKSKLKLSGANTYTGGTLVQNGVIIVGNAAATPARPWRLTISLPKRLPLPAHGARCNSTCPDSQIPSVCQQGRPHHRGLATPISTIPFASRTPGSRWKAQFREAFLPSSQPDNLPKQVEGLWLM